MIKLRIGRLRAEISPLFFAVVTYLLIFSQNGAVQAALFAAVMHELGHLCAMLMVGDLPKKLVLTPFGIKLERKADALTTGRYAAVYISGPAVNLLLSAVFFAFGDQTGMQTNAALGIFSLLPVGRLDGGCLLEYFLVLRFPANSDHIKNVFNISFLLPLTMAGICLLLKYGNPTLLITSAYLLAAVAVDGC